AAAVVRRGRGPGREAEGRSVAPLPLALLAGVAQPDPEVAAELGDDAPHEGLLALVVDPHELEVAEAPAAVARLLPRRGAYAEEVLGAGVLARLTRAEGARRSVAADHAGAAFERIVLRVAAAHRGEQAEGEG